MPPARLCLTVYAVDSAHSGVRSRDTRQCCVFVAGKDDNGRDGSGSEKDRADSSSGGGNGAPPPSAPEKDVTGAATPSSSRLNPNPPAAQARAADDENIHIHPRKRKLRQRQQQQQESSANSTVDLTQFNLFPRTQHQDKTSNPYEMYLDIRRKVAQRRLEMAVITPKAPQGFKDYLMVNCNYILQGNAASKKAIPLLTPPGGLEAAMKELFNEQEKARYRLRLQHHIERVSERRCLCRCC